MKNIGQRIKQYRQTKGLNMTALARKIGISHGTLSEIESGNNEPSAQTLRQLFRITDINPAWLLTGEGEMFPAASVHPGGKWDDVTEKILLLLKDMDLEKRRDVLKYLEKEKLLTELLAERKENCT